MYILAKPPERPTTSAASPSTIENSSKPSPVDVNKPLYTVPPTFKPPAVIQPTKPVAVAAKINMNTGEIDEVVKQMIAIQMDAFEAEMKQIKHQSRKLMENVIEKFKGVKTNY